MDDQRYTHWFNYYRELADLLDLRDWQVILRRGEPGNEKLMAETLITYGRRSQVLWLSSAFFTEPPEEQRQCLAHELLHIHYYPLQSVVHQAFDDDEQRTFCRLHHLSLETSLDSVATAIAKHLPLPPEVSDAN